jgi:hypothetical protein
MTVEEWTPRLAAALGLEESGNDSGTGSGTAIDIDAILALAGEVAHGVERKAAPVSAFVVGLAAGRAGGSPESVAAAMQATRRLLASSES